MLIALVISFVVLIVISVKCFKYYMMTRGLLLYLANKYELPQPEEMEGIFDHATKQWAHELFNGTEGCV